MLQFRDLAAQIRRQVLPADEKLVFEKQANNPADSDSRDTETVQLGDKTPQPDECSPECAILNELDLHDSTEDLNESETSPRYIFLQCSIGVESISPKH